MPVAKTPARASRAKFLRAWRMLMRTAAMSCLILASPAAAQSKAELSRLWDNFMRVCPLVLTDPNAYVQTLAIPGPNGEPVVHQSADGRVTEFDTTISGDFHHAVIVVVGKHQELGCGFTSNPMSALNAQSNPVDGNQFFQQTVARYENLDISGGKVSKQLSIGQGPVETDDYYQYYVTGLVPDVDTVTQVIFGQGFYALHMHRYMIAEAAQ